MATGKTRRTGKAGTKTPSKPAVTTAEIVDSVSVKLKAQSQYAQNGIEVMLTKHFIQGKEDMGEVMDALIAEGQERLDSYSEEYFNAEVPEEEYEEEEEDEGEEEEEDEDFEESEEDEDDSEEDEDEDFDEDDEDEDEEEELTEADVKKMKKAELVELIEEEELDVDPKEYKKIADLRNAVIEELFVEDEDEEDDGEEDDGEWDDEDWGDDE